MKTYQEHDARILKQIYLDMCTNEGIKPINIYFGRCGRGGAKCTYKANKPLYIVIDLSAIQVGSIYALCHEVAHQINIISGNATHNNAFKKTEKQLLKKYSNTPAARGLYW